MTDEELLATVKQVAASCDGAVVVAATRRDGRTRLEIEFKSAVAAAEFLQLLWKLGTINKLKLD